MALSTTEKVFSKARSVDADKDLTYISPTEAIIRFGVTKFSVNEPSEAGQVSVVKVPVLRVGDTSKVSVVRVHTKDGSATSGEDYHPISQGERTQLITHSTESQRNQCEKCILTQFIP